MSEFNIRIVQSAASRMEWNDFSQRAMSSYRGEYNLSRLPHAGSPLLSFVKRLDVLHDAVKIAQCAILIGLRSSSIADRIQILREYEIHSEIIIEKILNIVGRSSCIYGSEWSGDRLDFELVANINIIKKKDLYMEYIEFNRWQSLESYIDELPKNVKRNIKFASSHYPDLVVEAMRGWRALALLPSIYRLRKRSFERRLQRLKKIALLKTFMKLIILGDFNCVMVAKVSNKVVAYNHCIEYGSATYYLESGFDDRYRGVAWFLLTKTIGFDYERTGGRGKFVLGPVDDQTIDAPHWQGLARSRRQCLASIEKISTYILQYSG